MSADVPTGNTPGFYFTFLNFSIASTGIICGHSGVKDYLTLFEIMIITTSVDNSWA